ncbi:hypothetical protein [Streptomyces cadmiisoli]|uniref:hypothetical protein n=1 Tax=Streptomyces cadmiisoli TaxID=2184053 RepID=UPI003669E5CD
MHEIPNRAYRSIERGKIQLQGHIGTGQKVSASTRVKRMSRRGPTEVTYRLAVRLAARVNLRLR